MIPVTSGKHALRQIGKDVSANRTSIRSASGAKLAYYRKKVGSVREIVELTCADNATRELLRRAVSQPILGLETRESIL